MENPNELGSQIQGSTCSLSLPSESPDVRNWFSSYEYESPVLGTIDGFKDSVTGESEGFVIQESTKERENHLCKFNITHEILDSSCLPTQVSEPPDVGNWFSSYAYESFVLDTNDDVKDSVSQESKCDKEGSLVGDSQNEQEKMAAFREIKNYKSDKLDENCSSKILDSPDSPTVFTEPPDVKNWFSRYAYKSPVLGTSDQFEDSLQLEKEPEKFVIEDSDGEQEEKLIIIRKVRSRKEKVDEEKVHSNSITTNNSSIKVHEQKKDSKSIDRIGGKEIPPSQNSICSVKIFTDSLEGKTLQSNDMSPSKNIRERNFGDEGYISKLEPRFSQEACSVSSNLNRNSSSNKEKSRTKLFCRTDFIEEFMQDINPLSPESNSKLAQVCGASARKHIHRRNNKENDQKGIAENGFVATRKNGSARTANEGSSKRPQGILLECSSNKGTVCHASERDAARRKALMETTNYQNSDAFEVTGKWRCPQRSKPSLGPPLKQLRLERWVHRLQN